MPVRAVRNDESSPHEPSLFCCILSQRSARTTIASPAPPTPNLPSWRPRWPGSRLEKMPGILIGDFTFATVEMSLGLAETGSSVTSAGSSTGVMSPGSPSISDSFGSSVSGGGGGSSGGGSISTSSGGSMISTAAVTGGGASRRGSIRRIMTVISGTATATAGPERRCSWSLANLYSPVSFGILRPAIIRRQRSRKESSSKSFCISR